MIPDKSKVPSGARTVVQTLMAAGYEAYLVGGAVRDVLLERDLHDWDITTNATPEQVSACFERVIPTGIQHGTVTVLIEREPFEVTTYRVDGDYTDGRRPDGVHFTPNLEEDLARRDFTINAMAWCPETDRLVDPFDGQGDLGLRLVRAVGKAHERLSEDGLRAMRAVRFAAVLDFRIDEELEAALTSTLEVFSKVSIERIAVELRKTLMSRQPGWGIGALRRSGLLSVFLPEIAGLPEARFEVVCAALDRSPADFETRVALMVSPTGGQARELCGRLRWPKKVGELVQLLVSHQSVPLPSGDEGPALYSLVRRLGRTQLERFAGYRASLKGDLTVAERFLSACDQAGVDVVPLEVKELAIDGRTVIESLGIRPSKRVGVILEALLERTWSDPGLNEIEGLKSVLADVARSIEEAP